ncbi:hypothetical protein PRIPAC_90598, partial [Pristionchus pacificus]
LLFLDSIHLLIDCNTVDTLQLLIRFCTVLLGRRLAQQRYLFDIRLVLRMICIDILVFPVRFLIPCSSIEILIFTARRLILVLRCGRSISIPGFLVTRSFLVCRNIRSIEFL